MKKIEELKWEDYGQDLFIIGPFITTQDNREVPYVIKFWCSKRELMEELKMKNFHDFFEEMDMKIQALSGVYRRKLPKKPLKIKVIGYHAKIEIRSFKKPDVGEMPYQGYQAFIGKEGSQWNFAYLIQTATGYFNKEDLETLIMREFRAHKKGGQYSWICLCSYLLRMSMEEFVELFNKENLPSLCKEIYRFLQ